MSIKPASVLTRVSEGDCAAFKDLFHEFSPKVYGFALRLTHSETQAEEIVQDVFTKLWINRNSLSGVDNFPAYLYTITRNLTFNILKRISIEQKARAEFTKDFCEANCETEEAIVYRDYQNLLSNAIERLSPQQKSVYSLCQLEGLKYEEAAEKLHISRLTVKTHMQQAIRSIRSHFRHIVYFFGFLVSLLP